MKKIFIAFLMTLGFMAFAQEVEKDFEPTTVTIVELNDTEVKSELELKMDKIFNLLADRIIKVLEKSE